MPLGKIKTIDEALDYLYSFINYEANSSFPYKSINYNVDRTVKLLNLLRNPERNTKIIHIAGTKGKGSICKILSSLLKVQNYRTGLFTSPHIERVNERIEVDGREINDSEIIRILNIFQSIIADFPPDNKPTTFEILTAMAMFYFHVRGAKHIILETGMGGRFDSTNFSDPAISVIAPVSYDHMDKLGERIEDIAFEKAGIIKRGRPVVIGYQRYDVNGIFKRKSIEEKSRYYMVEEFCTYEIVDMSHDGSRFNTEIDGIQLKNLFFSLPGQHQVENAVTALLVLKILNLLPDEFNVANALKNIHFPTRLELIKKERSFLLDSAHNKDSAQALVDAIKEVYSYERLIAIVGIVKGKDVYGILENISSISDNLIVTEPVTHKKLDTDFVFHTAQSLLSKAILIRDIYDAIEYAIESSTKSDLILVTGSFYTTSPARSFILNRYRSFLTQ